MRSSPRNTLLAAAVEEIRHVRVLLGLGEPQLRQPGAATISPNTSELRTRAEQHGVREVLLVARHRREQQIVEPLDREVRRSPDRRTRASAARARSGRKLKKMHRVAVADRSRFADDRRQRRTRPFRRARRPPRARPARSEPIRRFGRSRARRTLSACVPSACRGPSRSSVREIVAIAPARSRSREARFEPVEIAPARCAAACRARREMRRSRAGPARPPPRRSALRDGRASCAPSRRRASPSDAACRRFACTCSTHARSVVFCANVPLGDLVVDHDQPLRYDPAAADVDVTDFAVAHHARRQADGFDRWPRATCADSARGCASSSADRRRRSRCRAHSRE